MTMNITYMIYSNKLCVIVTNVQPVSIDFYGLFINYLHCFSMTITDELLIE